MSDGILKKIEGNIDNAKKAIISNPANLAREANILGKNQNGESSVFTQEQFINTLAGTPKNGNEDEREGGYGFTEAQAQAAWDFLNIDTEGDSKEQLDDSEINFWINTYGADTDGVEENGNDTFSVSNLLSVIGIPDSNGNFMDSDQVSEEILDYLENLKAEGYDIDTEELGQQIQEEVGITTPQTDSTGGIEVVDEESVTDSLQGQEAPQTDSTGGIEVVGEESVTDGLQGQEASQTDSTGGIEVVGEESVTDGLQGQEAPQTDSTGGIEVVGEESVTDSLQGQEASQTDSTSPQTQEDLFKNAGLNGDLAQTRITVSEGIYTFTTDKYSDSKKDNLDCGSRIMRNIYGVSYSDQQYTGCYEALSILNGYGGDIPANAKFEVYSLKDLQTAAAEIANGTPIDEIKAKIAPLSEIKETSEPEATAVLHDENTETTPENYKEELDLRLAELNEALNGNEGTDKNGLKSLVEGLQLPDTNKVSVSAALEAAYYLTGGNSETLQELLSEDSLTRDELASIAGSEQYAYSQDHTLQPGDIVFRYGEDGTLLPSTVYDCDENGKLLVVQGGQETGNGTSNGIYIKEVEESGIKYVIPCGQEARTKAEAAEAETQATTAEGGAQATTAEGGAQATTEEALIATVQSEYGDMLEELQITSTISKAEESEDGSLSLSFDDGTTAKISDEQIITYDEQNNPIAGVNLTEDGIAEFLDENATLEINELGLNNPTFNARGGIITATDEDGKVVTFSQDGKIKDITEASGIQTMKDGVEIPYAKAAQNEINELGISKEDIIIDNENGTISFNHETNGNTLNYNYKNNENGYTLALDLVNGTIRVIEEYSNGEEFPTAEIMEIYSDSSKTTLKSLTVKGNPTTLPEEAENAINEFYINHENILEEHGINKENIKTISMEKSEDGKNYTIKLDNGNTISISDNKVTIYGNTQDTSSEIDNKIVEIYTPEGELSSIEINGNPEGLVPIEIENIINDFQENYLSILNEAGINSPLTRINFKEDGTTLYTLEDGTIIEETQAGNRKRTTFNDNTIITTQDDDGNRTIELYNNGKLESTEKISVNKDGSITKELYSSEDILLQITTEYTDRTETTVYDDGKNMLYTITESNDGNSITYTRENQESFNEYIREILHQIVEENGYSYDNQNMAYDNFIRNYDYNNPIKEVTINQNGEIVFIKEDGTIETFGASTTTLFNDEVSEQCNGNGITYFEHEIINEGASLPYCTKEILFGNEKLCDAYTDGDVTSYNSFEYYGIDFVAGRLTEKGWNATAIQNALNTFENLGNNKYLTELPNNSIIMGSDSSIRIIAPNENNGVSYFDIKLNAEDYKTAKFTYIDGQLSVTIEGTRTYTIDENGNIEGYEYD